jgi:hypothetical protein
MVHLVLIVVIDIQKRTHSGNYLQVRMVVNYVKIVWRTSVISPIFSKIKEVIKMAQNQFDSLIVYGSSSNEVITFDRSGNRIIKRVFTPRRFKEVLSEVYTGMLKAANDKQQFVMIAFSGHMDAMSKVASRLEMFGVSPVDDSFDIETQVLTQEELSKRRFPPRPRAVLRLVYELDAQELPELATVLGDL